LTSITTNHAPSNESDAAFSLAFAVVLLVAFICPSQTKRELGYAPLFLDICYLGRVFERVCSISNRSTLRIMAAARCVVSFEDDEGIRHCTYGQAESLFETVALSISEFRVVAEMWR
jgi:hypothetical protein